jgi:hypothetical protein
MEETVGSEYIQRHRYDAHHRHIGLQHHHHSRHIRKLTPEVARGEMGDPAGQRGNHFLYDPSWSGGCRGSGGHHGRHIHVITNLQGWIQLETDGERLWVEVERNTS